MRNVHSVCRYNEHIHALQLLGKGVPSPVTQPLSVTPDPVKLGLSKPASPNYISAVLDLLTSLVATLLQLLSKYSPPP